MKNVELIDAMYKIKKENIDWITLTTKETPKLEELNIYEAGFVAGWRQAVAYLKLHGEVKLKD